MQQVITKRFSGTPFTVTCSQVENRPGTWNSTKVSIYKGETMIGEYLRNYSDAGQDTFYPFFQNGQWYALYSADYTALRVMKLHDEAIEDWCGDLRKENGFCPVEVYVPKYNTIHEAYMQGDQKHEFDYYTVDSDVTELEFIQESKLEGYRGTTYCDFALVCGCIWGDDHSWKIRHIDLSDIENKNLIISEKFGYWEMPSSLKLKQCVDMGGWEPDIPYMRLTKAETVSLGPNANS